MKSTRRFRTARVWAAIVALLTVCTATIGFAADGDKAKVNPGWEFARANRLASAGAITRSIPHYEKVLAAAPDKFPQAYFNLAEVYRFKKKCRKSVILYNAYMRFEQQAQNVADAKKAMAQCTNGKKTGTLSLAVEPKAGAIVTVDGYVMGRGSDVDKIEVLPGEYEVGARLEDYLPQTATVEVAADKDASHAFELEKKLFYGELKIAVDQKGATIKIEPKKLESPRAKSATIEETSPMEKPHKLATGKYFIEVTKPGYDRWIRNVTVRKDDTTSVDVTMSEALPEAIRAQ